MESFELTNQILELRFETTTFAIASERKSYASQLIFLRKF